MTDDISLRNRHEATPVQPPPAQRRVLLVEDSSATTDLVTLVLTQAGHDVTAVGDGISAVTALRDKQFDVVLTDFHLPDINGIEVVQQYRAAPRPNEPAPNFIAITGDVRGLLSDAANCEVFDRVVSKPLDIDAVCALVEHPIQPRERPVTTTESKRGAIEDLPFAFLRWPAPAAMPPGLVGIDAILVTAETDMSGLWALAGAHLFPVIDLTGKLGARADMDAQTLRYGDDARVHDLISKFHDRRAELHGDFRNTEDIADKILARAFVANTALVPRRTGNARGLISWNTIAPADDMDAALQRLRKDDLVQLSFYERLHHCPACESARLIAREQCPSCRSADLNEQSYLHHFRCAYQGPESDFASGDDLVCPKCRRTLAHFGTDYDRPGQFVTCSSCAQSTSEPDVTFVCADCDAISASDAAILRTVYQADLTERGRAYLAAGRAALGHATTAFRFSDLPFDLVIALNRAASAYNDTKIAFSLARITFPGTLELRVEHGARQVEEARRLWFETFQQSCAQETTCAMGQTDGYVLLPETDPKAAQATVDAASATASRSVRLPLQISAQLFGPEDLAR